MLHAIWVHACGHPHPMPTLLRAIFSEINTVLCQAGMLTSCTWPSVFLKGRTGWIKRIPTKYSLWMRLTCQTLTAATYLFTRLCVQQATMGSISERLPCGQADTSFGNCLFLLPNWMTCLLAYKDHRPCGLTGPIFQWPSTSEGASVSDWGKVCSKTSLPPLAHLKAMAHFH